MLTGLTKNKVINILKDRRNVEQYVGPQSNSGTNKIFRWSRQQSTIYDAKHLKCQNKFTGFCGTLVLTFSVFDILDWLLLLHTYSDYPSCLLNNLIILFLLCWPSYRYIIIMSLPLELVFSFLKKGQIYMSETSTKVK